MGKIGRKAVEKITPKWKKKYKPDVIIANGENLAHGIGITEKTARQVFDAGVDFLTGGNHTFDKTSDLYIWNDEVFEKKLLRPANLTPLIPPLILRGGKEGLPGEGVKIIDVKGNKLMLINLMGRVFFKEEYLDPFKMMNEILKDKPKDIKCVILDFHAEATSEKNALGWYLDGGISAIIGTHTHIPTADAKILPQGAAYITDVGMVGARDSVLGENKDAIINAFLTDSGFKHDIPEKGEAIIGAVLLKIDEKTGKAKKIERLEETIKI